MSWEQSSRETFTIYLSDHIFFPSLKKKWKQSENFQRIHHSHSPVHKLEHSPFLPDVIHAISKLFPQWKSEFHTISHLSFLFKVIAPEILPLTFSYNINYSLCATDGSASKESTHHAGEFDPWVRIIPCWRARQPTSVFLPGELNGQRSLAGCRPLSHIE